MTNEEKEIVLSIFGRFGRDDYIGEEFSIPDAIQAYGQFPLTAAVREVTWDIIRKTEFTLSIQNGGGSGDDRNIS